MRSFCYSVGTVRILRKINQNIASISIGTKVIKIYQICGYKLNSDK